MPGINKVLLLGATGYVGGTVLDHLINSKEPSIKALSFDLPVRNKDTTERLRKAYGNRVNPILWRDREWDNTNGRAVYEFLKAADESDPYPQRSAEIAVLMAAENTGVQAVSLNSPCIFGIGTGLFNQQGFIIPTFMRYVIQHGYGFKLNDTAVFDWVHVDDLADVFVLLVQTILGREDRGVGYIPSGKSGIISTAVKRDLQTEMMQLCLDAAFDLGVLPREDTPKKKEIREVSLQEIADEIIDDLVGMAELSWAGHKAFKGTVAKKLLGWHPTRLDEA
ncbi:hypothetical protein QQX98_001002 [Neonectria punicea]|uniref:NAD-dependent epimerase/dehydratase domain-containing protein n=1 Tax=Neonectria punicea TaxID=979145 RepID=A0ABR1HRT8_9HYPO